MRTIGLVLALSFLARAADEPAAKPAASEEEARAALKTFDEEFRAAKTTQDKQNVVYGLHDVRHDLVLARLEKLLRDKDPGVRNVAALAIAGQTQNREKAGALLWKSWQWDYKTDEVVFSVLQAMREIAFLGYWPDLQKSLSDERNAIVIGSLDLLGKNKDWRAIDRLLEMYRTSLPKRYTWQTGTVTVDTGAEGEGDNDAAKAAFAAKYGEGGSKEKAKAQAKARSADDRNFSAQLRRAVKEITGQDFENAFDFEDWYLANYVEIRRKVAAMEGKDADAAARKAEGEVGALKAKAAEDRKKLEEEMERQRELMEARQKQEQERKEK